MGWDTVSSATFQLCYLCLSDLLYVCMYVRMIGWIDSLRALAASHVSDAMFQNASNRFPENTPVTKEVHTYIMYIQDYYTYLKRNTYIQTYLLCIMYSTYAYTVYIHAYIHTTYIFVCHRRISTAPSSRTITRRMPPSRLYQGVLRSPAPLRGTY